MKYNQQETIAAIATPPGEGGIAIIRISGDRAIQIASKIFSGPVMTYKSHTAHLGKVIDDKGRPIDRALLLIMRAPHSYTGEDTIELQCHGGALISRKVLEAVLFAGARAALPGEFTFKAFLNRKLDLAQAEAVQGVIGAKNEQAYEMANRHLEGALSKKIQSFQSSLVHFAAILEAWIDFPDENLEFISIDKLMQSLISIKKEMEKLYSTFHDGRKLDHGIEVCIVGPPNAGKSSLMNALLGKDHAIVTPIAGTTRDLLQQEMTLNGLLFRLTDTAGIHNTEEIIEKEGIRRSKQAIQKADGVLFVVDSAKGIEESLLATLYKEKTLIVWNKIDLPESSISQVPFPYQVQISATQQMGLEKLKQTLEQLIWQEGIPSKDEVLIASVRHKEALKGAIKGVEGVIEGLKDHVSPEWLTADIREALTDLGKIIGTDITEDILSSIFSQFCIGK